MNYVAEALLAAEASINAVLAPLGYRTVSDVYSNGQALKFTFESWIAPGLPLPAAPEEQKP